MNDIIKAIEDEQLKSDITDFNVGDTARLSRVPESVSRYMRVQF